MQEIKDINLWKKVVNAEYDLNQTSCINYREEIRLSNVEALVGCITFQWRNRQGHLTKDDDGVT